MYSLFQCPLCQCILEAVAMLDPPLPRRFALGIFLALGCHLIGDLFRTCDRKELRGGLSSGSQVYGVCES